MALWTDLEGLTIAGRYELRAHLATGGMAAVYRGWDDRLSRPVAVKLLRDDGSTQAVDLARFRREARAVAALRSPHIVEVYDFVECDDRTYLIMELVDGPNLKQHILDNGALPVGEALTYAIEVCRALAQTHARGYIHRDIKPQNILLDSSGSAKLTDFGIVQVGGGASLTASGLVLGTADYIAPEQAQGLALEPGSDLYSLGIVLFEMLTASVPFNGATATAVALRHTTEPLPPLRPRNPDVPPLVERIVQRATAKDPRQRFISARQMEAALTHALAVCNQPEAAHAHAERSARSQWAAGHTTHPSISATAHTRSASTSASAYQLDASEEPGDLEELDWHDVALLLSSTTWLTPGDTLADTSDAVGASEERPLAAGATLPAALGIAWEQRPPGGSSMFTALCGALMRGLRMRLALTLGVALLLCVAVLVLRVLA